jgi:hypothetical protein
MALSFSGGNMGRVSDDDDMGTRAAGEVPVISDPAKDRETAAEPDREGDKDGVEEWLAPAPEEAGYGYGV